MELSALSALSPLDGRYVRKTGALRPILSEAGFMRHRVKVEIAWLKALSKAGFSEIRPFSDVTNKFLDALVNDFAVDDARPYQGPLKPSLTTTSKRWNTGSRNP